MYLLNILSNYYYARNKILIATLLRVHIYTRNVRNMRNLHKRKRRNAFRAFKLISIRI